MKTIMKALFVMAMVLTLGATYANAAVTGPAYTDFINGIPSAGAVNTPDVMGSWQ